MIIELIGTGLISAVATAFVCGKINEKDLEHERKNGKDHVERWEGIADNLYDENRRLNLRIDLLKNELDSVGREYNKLAKDVRSEYSKAIIDMSKSCNRIIQNFEAIDSMNKLQLKAIENEQRNIDQTMEQTSTNQSNAG